MKGPKNLQGTPEPGEAPNIVNGSFGTNDQTDIEMLDGVDALAASGITTVFASGNVHGTQTIDRPASFRLGFGVGAVGHPDQFGNVALATYSSEGPAPTLIPTLTAVPYASTNLVKPEVVAPGGNRDGTPSDDVRSSVPKTGCLYTPPPGGNIFCDPSGYNTHGGTSMAAPHVTGLAPCFCL